MQNVRAENAIGFRVGDELDHSFHVIAAKRAAVGAEWKFADAHIDPLLFRLIFGETDAGQLWICVNDTGNRVVVHVTGFARDDFHARDPFVFGFVRQHRTGNHIADGINAFDVRAEMFVHFDALLFVELDTDFFRAESVRERATPD